MRLNEKELKRLYQQSTARLSDRSECLTADEITSAAEGRTSEDNRIKVTDHLMACSDCAQEYRILTSLEPWADQVAVFSGAASSSPRLVQVEREKRSGAWRGDWWSRFGAAFSTAGAAYAMATALLVVTLAVIVWMVTQRREGQQVIARLDQEVAQRDQTLTATKESLDETRRQLEEANRRGSSSEQAQKYEGQIAELQRNLDELSRPQMNAPIIDLEPQGSTRGASLAAKTIEVPSSANLFTLVLNVAGEQNYSSFALEIAERSGKVIWRGAGLRKSQFNTFTVTLSRRLLPTGSYHIKLYGVGGNQTKMVEDYAVQIHNK
jgi:hypothetical protein